MIVRGMNMNFNKINRSFIRNNYNILSSKKKMLVEKWFCRNLGAFRLNMRVRRKLRIRIYRFSTAWVITIVRIKIKNNSSRIRMSFLTRILRIIIISLNSRTNSISSKSSSLISMILITRVNIVSKNNNNRKWR